MGTVSDSTIDTPTVSSCERDDIISNNSVSLSKEALFDMVSTLQVEVAFGTSMVLSDIVMLVYYKVSEQSWSVGACILMVKLCNYCEK